RSPPLRRVVGPHRAGHTVIQLTQFTARFTMTQATLSPTDMIDRWLGIYGAADADAAALLVDRHDPDAVAFTVIEVEDSADADAAPKPITTDITYGELAERSKRFAAALAELGVGRGDTVGVLMGKREELVVSLLAIARL